MQESPVLRSSSFSRLMLLVLLSLQPESAPAQPERCGTPSTSNSTNQVLSSEFVMYRPGTLGADVRYRDLEFGWDTLFAAKMSLAVQQTLDGWAGRLLLNTNISPVATDGRGLEVVHNTFRMEGVDWTSDLNQRPLRLGPGANAFSAEDRGHADVYLTVPNRLYYSTGEARNFGGRYPSEWNAYGEDVSSGLPADTALKFNSFSLDGPPIGQEIDTLGTGWTRPRTSYQTYFHHEFQHSLPPVQTAGNNTEFWSGGAEVVGGHFDLGSPSEFPYNRALPNEYQARTGLMAYLAYNFLNADTNRTLAGMQDDLLYKWAKVRANQGGLQQLGTFLTDAQCATCATKQYFRPGGVSLSAERRVGVLLHHWRMAMFADHPTFDEGQFGFAAWSGFKPSLNLKAWTSFAGTLADDVDALPQVVTLTVGEIATPREFKHTRTLHGGTRALALSQAGANYWVIRADSALRTQNRRLVARISPLSVLRSFSGTSGGGRLHASFLTYSNVDTAASEESILWRHPEWLSGSTPTQTLELDSTASELELEVPDFGQTTKVAVLVMTIGDGRFGAWGNDMNLLTNDALHYRLGLDLRESTEPFLATSLFATEDSTRAAPAWAPDDTTLVFSAAEASGLVRLWRKSITGGAPRALNQQAISQLYPDCAPFSDLVVYEGIPNPQQAYETNLYLSPLTPTTSTTATQITSHTGCEAFPAFQPDGKGIAYLHNSSYNNWDLRWVAVDGTGDLLLASLGPLTNGVCRPRWSPDGNKIYVVMANAGNRIHSVPKAGGTPTLVDDHPMPVMSFDIHHGLGPNAIATTLPLVATTPLGAAPIDAPRIALYVSPTATRDTVFRLNRSARIMDAPRISPRGTRLVAQSRRASGVTSIHWGRIEDNLPPSIGSLSAQSGLACLPLQVSLPASDPEGEALSWSMAYAPPGSQIIQGNVFRWQFPVVGEYDAVFRARDPRGGLDSRLIHISITDGGYCEDPLSGGGEGGGGFRSGEALPRNVGASTATWAAQHSNSFLDGADSGDWMTHIASLPELPISISGEYEVVMRSGSSGGASLDRVELLAVDHAEGVVVAAGPAGLTLGRKAPPLSIELSGGDAIGREPVHVDAGTVAEIEFSPSNEARGVLVTCQQSGSTAAGIEVLRPSGSDWEVVDRIHPRRALDCIATLGTVSDIVRLRFTAPTLLLGVGRLLWSPEDQASVTTHRVDASGIDGATPGTMLRVADQVALRVEQGFPRSLTFVAPPLAEGRTRRLFLSLTGRVETATAASRAPVAGAGSPSPRLRFGIAGIEPNPAATQAAIGFTLSEAGETELAVFDVQGARVRSLTRGPLAAGAHRVVWDGLDEVGARAAAGTYFVRLSNGAKRARGRLVLLP